MRWVPFVILVYVTVLVQTTLGRVMTFHTAGMGRVGPDLAAIVAVFLALRLRDGVELALAAWALGLAVDLASGAGGGLGAAVGPMALAYVVASAAVFRLREEMFRERPVVQVLLAAIFCLLAHGIWVTFQSVLLENGQGGWARYWRTMKQAVALAAYTAVLAPIGCWILGKCERLLIAVQAGRSRHGRR